jgi:hypothetical protein
MTVFNPPGTNQQRSGLYKDQLLTIQDLIDFREQLLIDIHKLLKEQGGDPGHQWLKAGDVKRMLRISESKLQYLRDQGIIPFKKLGGVTYYDKNEIQEMMNSSRVKDRLQLT